MINTKKELSKERKTCAKVYKNKERNIVAV